MEIGLQKVVMLLLGSLTRAKVLQVDRSFVQGFAYDNSLEIRVIGCKRSEVVDAVFLGHAPDAITWHSGTASAIFLGFEVWSFHCSIGSHPYE